MKSYSKASRFQTNLFLFGTHRSSTTSRTFQGEKSVHGPSQVSNLHFALLCYFCEVLTRLQYLDLLLRCLEKVPKICSQMVVTNGDLSKKSTLNKSKRRPWECFSHEIVRYLCCCPSHVHPPSKSAKNLSRITGNRTSSPGMMNLKCFQNDTPLKINGLNIQTYIHILYIQTHINRPNPKLYVFPWLNHYDCRLSVPQHGLLPLHFRLRMSTAHHASPFRTKKRLVRRAWFKGCFNTPLDHAPGNPPSQL